jgi:CRISPR-associated protein Cas1
MRRLLNTLYVVTEGAWVRKDGQNVVVDLEGEERGRVPIHLLGSIVCLGAVGVTPPLLASCAERGVCVVLLSRSGQFIARIEGPQSGNVLLRRSQHEATRAAPTAARVAGAIVAAKAMNQRAVLRRCARDYSEQLSPDARQRLEAADRKLLACAQRASTADTVDSVRGREGEAAAVYFEHFPLCVRREEPEFVFSGRSRRPPLDATNALLSFLYVLVVHDCRAALECVGLDPQIGFLHTDRPGRASLALDLAEEFRAPLADRVVLTLLNRRQLQPKDFERREQGAVYLKDDARKVVLEAYQERKRIELKHPFLGESAPLGLFPLLQAQLMARHLRRDIDGYPAFIWK